MWSLAKLNWALPFEFQTAWFTRAQAIIGEFNSQELSKSTQVIATLRLKVPGSFIETLQAHSRQPHPLFLEQYNYPVNGSSSI